MSTMTRRSLAGGCLGALASRGFARAAARPNVLIVLTDDQGYGDLSSHGNPHVRTPELDRLRAGAP